MATISQIFSIFLNENVRISICISLNFVSKGPVDNILVLVPIMAWRGLRDMTLSEPIMFSLLTYIYVTRSQWVLRIYVSVTLLVLEEMSNGERLGKLAIFHDIQIKHGCNILCHVCKYEHGSRVPVPEHEAQLVRNIMNVCITVSWVEIILQLNNISPAAMTYDFIKVTVLMEILRGLFIYLWYNNYNNNTDHAIASSMNIISKTLFCYALVDCVIAVASFTYMV